MFTTIGFAPPVHWSAPPGDLYDNDGYKIPMSFPHSRAEGLSADTKCPKQASGALVKLKYNSKNFSCRITKLVPYEMTSIRILASSEPER